MTNYEKIKTMSVEEMAEYLSCLKLGCDTICVAAELWGIKNHTEESCCSSCVQAIKAWLESEVER